MIKPRAFSMDEIETTFTIDGTNRNLVRVYTNDPVFIRKLNRVGAKVVSEEPDGGMFYDLPANQLRVSMPPREITEEEKEASKARMEKLRAAGKL